MRHTIIDASQLELEEKVVSIKRVTKVVKGGRTMRFTALVVVGDGNGHVGAGLGKAAEIPEAIRKGKEDAMKKLVTVARDENNSITHDYVGKFGSAEMLLKRAPEGTGVIAGGPARAVIELAGIKNIRTKSLGSNNKQNVVLATIEGLRQLKTPEEVAAEATEAAKGISKDDLKFAYATRSSLLIMRNCENVYVGDITIENPSNHSVNILDSRNIATTNVLVFSL